MQMIGTPFSLIPSLVAFRTLIPVSGVAAQLTDGQRSASEVAVALPKHLAVRCLRRQVAGDNRLAFQANPGFKHDTTLLQDWLRMNEEVRRCGVVFKR